MSTEKLLHELLNAYDGGHVRIDSEEIGGEPPQGFDDPGVAPHSWHEEWIYHARFALSVPEAPPSALREALEEIRRWSEAYPIAVFPEPDLKKAHELLKAGGMTLDAISADVSRHVLQGVTDILDAALSAPEAQKPDLPSYVFTNPTLRIEALEAALQEARRYLIIPEGPHGTMQELVARIDALLAGSKPWKSS